MFNNDNNQGYNKQMFGEDGKQQYGHNDGFSQDNGVNNLSFAIQDNTGETLNSYTTKTFLWMFLGLVSTFVTAIVFAVSGLWISVFSVPAAPFILLIAELFVVMFLSARIAHLKASTAVILFFLYAILNGVTFTTFFILYDLTVLIFVFGLTALFFAGLAIYGFVTKTDLTRLGPILFGGLIFLLVYFVVGMFINLSMFDMVVSIIGLAIFMALTAYDTQKIKAYYAAYGSNSEMAKKTSIICALQLYLDFINIFIYLLRILGRRK